jgi:hypothetical protein
VRRYAVRLTVAVLVAATVGLGASGPAAAAPCSTARGVTVVVDFHQLGGVGAACDASGGGKTAATQLTDVGHQLTYVQRQPGFVCRVDGTPKDDPCVTTPPSDAYWSLWWSDGTSGRWTYSSAGVGSLKVPAGGYVALSWQGGGDKAPPRVTPAPHTAPSSSPTAHPSSAPPSAPPSSPPASSVPPSTPSASSTGPSAPRSSRKAGHANHHHASPPSAGDGHGHGPGARSRGPGTTQAGGALDPATPADGGSGLPGWVAPAVVVLVFAAAGAVLVVRRRGSGSP